MGVEPAFQSETVPSEGETVSTPQHDRRIDVYCRNIDNLLTTARRLLRGSPLAPTTSFQEDPGMSDKRTTKATSHTASKSSKSSPATSKTVPQETRRNIYTPGRERGLHSRILNSNG